MSDPETTVYVRTKHCGGSSTTLHTDPDCPRLAPSRVVEKARGQYPAETPLCQFCSGEYTPHDGDDTGPWQALEAMDADDLVTDGGQDTIDGSATPRWDDDIHAAEDLYREASMQWGGDAQMAKASEEFSELAAVCARDLNRQADQHQLLEELIDARLMIEQIAQQITDEALEDMAEQKLDALAGRLQGVEST